MLCRQKCIVIRVVCRTITYSVVCQGKLCGKAVFQLCYVSLVPGQA